MSAATEMSPVEIDTQLAVHNNERNLGHARREHAIGQLRRAVADHKGDHDYYRPNHRAAAVAELLADAHAVPADCNTPAAGRVRRALTAIAAADAQVTAADTAAEPYETEFIRRDGWNRAFLVVGSDNGHVHRSSHCRTCNRNGIATRFEWLVDYSGRTEDEIVADAGWRACTQCYPTAPLGTPDSLPSAMLSSEDRTRQEAAAARAAAKAEAQRKAVANGLTADGSPLKIEMLDTRGRGHRESFKTERAARNWVVGKLAEEAAWGYSADAYRDGIAVVLAAIATKHNQSLDEVRADIDRRVAQAVRRRS